MKCSRCIWSRNKYKINCLSCWGNKNADIVFVGEAFGASERDNYLKTGDPEPFVGKAGDNFLQLLESANLKKTNIALMNAIRCYDIDNKTPSKKELDTCFIYTFLDIQKIKPKLTVAMGASALYQLTNKTDVSMYRGKVLWSNKINCKVFVTYHPAAAIYDKEKWKFLVEDFKNIIPSIDKEPFEIKHYDFVLIDTRESYPQIHESLKNTVLFLDVEAWGLDPYTDKLRLLQLGDRQGNIYLFPAKILPEIKEELKEVFDTSQFIGQGFEYDAKFLKVQLDLFPKIWLFDTCLAEFILTGMKDNDLTYLTGKYVPELYGYDDKIKALGGAHKVKNDVDLYQYGADDIGVLPKIVRSQGKELIRNKFDWLYNNITLPCNRVLTKISLRGIKYDLDKLWETDKKLLNEAKSSYEEISFLDSIILCEKKFKQKFNPRSYPMVRWLLIDHYGLPVLKTSNKTNNPSIGQAEMKIYAEKHKNPYCKAMEKYRSLQNIRNNFLSGVVPKLQGDVAHTTYSLHATETGRPNSSNPNLLNIPDDPDIRRIFIARPGYIFIYGDFSQIEVRVASIIYYDKNLIRACNTPGVDFHSMIASQTNNIPYDEFYSRYKAGDREIEVKRTAAKSITFGVLYQMGPDELAYRLGISLKKANQFIRDYFDGYPGLEKGIKDIKEFVIKNGYVDTYFGFRRRWRYHSENDKATLREAVNSPIQGGSWNLMELALIKVDKYLEDKKSKLCLQVYDSLVVEAYESEVDEVAKNVHKIMTTINEPYKKLNDVKLFVDLRVGKNLYDLEKI